MLREAAGAEVALQRVRIAGRPGVWTLRLRDGRIAGMARVDEAERGALVVVPGFHDAHVHLLAMAREREALRLPAGLRGSGALAATLRAAADALPLGAWLRVRGFDPETMTGGWIPDRAWLDGAVADRPVRVQHRNLRLDVLNGAALARCDAALPADGRVFQAGAAIRDPAAEDPQRLEALVGEVSRALLAHGVTSVQDAGEANGAAELALLAGLADRGAIRQRLWTMVSGAQLRDGRVSALDPRRVRHAKLAAIEARLDVDGLVASARAARAHGLGVAIHAVTEAELAVAVAVLEEAPGPARIEHAAVSPPALVAAVARTGATVVANPSLVTEAGDGYLDRHAPDEVPHLHRLATWRRAGVPLVLASDAPVTPSRPLAMLAAATARTTASGRPLGPAEALAERSALRALTRSPGRLAGERRLGRIAPGAPADLVAIEPGPGGRLAGGTVALTVLRGVPVHEA